MARTNRHDFVESHAWRQGLPDGAMIETALEVVVCGAAFGSLHDKFGVRWTVNSPRGTRLAETRDVDLFVGGDQADARDIAAMVASHRAWTMRHSPTEHCHSLDQQRAVDPAVTLFGARRGGKLVGVGALRHLDDGHVELKSMRVDAAARGAGVGRAFLERLLVEAAERGYRRVSLETGTMEAFAPARAWYASAGFLPLPFGGYTDNPYSACMTLELG